MTKEEIDERGVRTWGKMAELMKLKGPSLAIGEMLRDAPEATSAAIAWLAAQPIERRNKLHNSVRSHRSDGPKGGGHIFWQEGIALGVLKVIDETYWTEGPKNNERARAFLDGPIKPRKPIMGRCCVQ